MQSFKKLALSLSFLTILGLPTALLADGVFETPAAPAKKVKKHRRVARQAPAPEPAPLIPPPPTCVPNSPNPKVQLVSWEPKQKVKKILGSIQECVTSQWDVLKLLGGPNTIGLDYPSEKEMWGYQSIWSYKLANPIEETVIMMDNPGKRALKNKTPVELFVVFNDHDVVEKVEMQLIKRRR